MRKVVVPREVLAAEIRAGRVTVSGAGLKAAGGALGGGLGAAAGELAQWRAKQKLGEAATETAGSELKFPPGCCNCLRDGMQVRSIPMTSTVGRSVEYAFRFSVPHCRDCADTARRNRPSGVGMAAGFVAVSLLSLVILIVVAVMMNSGPATIAAFALAPLCGLALPRLWMKLRRPKPGQASRYQAVYVSSVGFESDGRPSEITLAFENPEYAERFLTLNAKSGVFEF